MSNPADAITDEMLVWAVLVVNEMRDEDTGACTTTVHTAYKQKMRNPHEWPVHLYTAILDGLSPK
jgi:hypothetical protein